MRITRCIVRLSGIRVTVADHDDHGTGAQHRVPRAPVAVAGRLLTHTRTGLPALIAIAPSASTFSRSLLSSHMSGVQSSRRTPSGVVIV